MKIEVQKSIRADLLGGTLDLSPIHLILDRVATLNCALQLKARVILETGQTGGISIVSKDYRRTDFFSRDEFTPANLRSGHFKGMAFVACLLDFFGVREGINMELQSGSPPGAGLGGSSTMGLALFEALCRWCGRDFGRTQAVRTVQSIEAQILNAGPAGYQDYYPALYGGILGLVPAYGEVRVEQYFSPALKEALEEHLTLIYSGQTRASGINNWQVYKNFFDNAGTTRRDLQEIADLAARAREAVSSGDFDQLLNLVAQEGRKRHQLFPQMITEDMTDLHRRLAKSLPNLGIKVCGAGGGGAFLLVHQKGQRPLIRKEAERAGMRLLDFAIAAPEELGAN